MGAEELKSDVVTLALAKERRATSASQRVPLRSGERYPSTTTTTRILLATFAAATVASLALSASAAVEQAPIPLKPSTGFRNYCGTHKKCPRGAVPRRVWRPLALPSIAPGSPCPVATPHRVSKMFAPVLGRGPVYFAAGAYNPADRATMTAPWPASDGSIAGGTGWTVAKTPLMMKKGFHQPLLARARQIDGVGQVGFSGPGSKRPFAAMQFPANGFAIPLRKYKALSLVVWVAAPGCYALQLDGLTFSRVIVFRVAFYS